MDFIKLVQKKEQILDNKLIIGLVFVIILIISVIIFWPRSSKHQLLSYLPPETSFYWHWTNKNYFSQDFWQIAEPNNRLKYLENVLGSNFFNLQEILWFQLEGNSVNNNYLLRFSRLPQSFVNDLQSKNPDLNIYNPQPNILLINRGKNLTSLTAELENKSYFSEGVSVYWQKNKAPDFLSELSVILEPLFSGQEVFINWQNDFQQINRVVLLDQNSTNIKNFKNFFIPSKFDLAFGFGKQIDNDLAENISNNLLKSFFDTLPYYNLSVEAIGERILNDALLWQDGDNWILASHQPFTENIFDFIKNLKVEETKKVLADGTAYTELVAAKDQDIQEHQINGQKILQIDEVFLWDIGEQHYLSNSQALMTDLSTGRHHLSDLLKNCSSNLTADIGDLLYLKTANLPDSQLKNYLTNHQITKLEMFSYATGTISGLNICF